MEELAKADIFFFVTTIVVAVVGLLVAILLIYAIKLLNDLKHFLAMLQEEVEEVIDDLEELSDKIKEKASTFNKLFSVVTTAKLFRSIIGSGKKRKKKK